MKEKPTIQELEEMLDQKEGGLIEVLPNGEIRAVKEVVVKNSASRMNAKAVLEDKIKRIKRKADALEIIYELIPDDLPTVEEEKLWSLFVDLK